MTQPLDYNVIFAQYISVCNKALEKNADKFPFKQILSSVRARDKGEIIDVEILGNDQAAYFRLRIDADKIRAVPVCKNKLSGTCCGGCRNRQWQTQVSYLLDVIQNEELYINNPALINWEWLHEPNEDYLSLQGKSEVHAEQL